MKARAVPECLKSSQLLIDKMSSGFCVWEKHTICFFFFFLYSHIIVSTKTSVMLKGIGISPYQQVCDSSVDTTPGIIECNLVLTLSSWKYQISLIKG